MIEQLTCAGCRHKIVFSGDSVSKCTNPFCPAPYEFCFFKTLKEARDCYDSASSWMPKEIHSSDAKGYPWAVGAVSRPVSPFRVPSITYLIAEDVLRSMQAGSADNIGGPLTLFGVQFDTEGTVQVVRIEPLEYKGYFGEKPHMRHFTEFCARLRLSEHEGSSGDLFCKAFDIERVREYVVSAPYEPRWHFCWCGLVDYIVPVIVSGEIIAVLFSGQKRLENEEANKSMRKLIRNACARLRISAKEMIALALKDDVKPVREADIKTDLARVGEVAHRLVSEAEDKCAAARQLHENHFLLEMSARFRKAHSSQELSRDAIWVVVRAVLDRTQRYLECFDIVWFLTEGVPLSSSFQFVAPSDTATNTEPIALPSVYFDEYVPDRTGVFFLSAKDRADLFRCLATRADRTTIDFGYAVRFFLHDNSQALLVLLASMHDCRLRAGPLYCQRRNQATVDFLTRFAEVLKKEIDTLLFINHLLAEEERHHAFLVRSAHSLSLPIQSVLADSASLVDALSEDEPDLREAQEMAFHGFNEIQGLRLVLENILHGAEEETEEPSPIMKRVCISEPLEKARTMFEAEAREKGCNIPPPKIFDGKPMPEIEMDSDQLNLVFMNLIHNAVKYSYRTARRGKRRFVEIRCGYVDGDEAQYKISVSNYGVGILPVEIEKGLIWLPRYRGRQSRDRNRTGSGLGLSHVKRAVEKVHGGSVSAESVQQPGGAHLTIITVLLPIRGDNSIVEGH